VLQTAEEAVDVEASRYNRIKLAHRDIPKKINLGEEKPQGTNPCGRSSKRYLEER
jgi:hypothetical protein